MALSRGGTNLDVFVRDLGNGSLTRMTTNSAADTEPVYSPDGRWIAYYSDASDRPATRRASSRVLPVCR